MKIVSEGELKRKVLGAFESRDPYNVSEPWFCQQRADLTTGIMRWRERTGSTFSNQIDTSKLRIERQCSASTRVGVSNSQLKCLSFPKFRSDLEDGPAFSDAVDGSALPSRSDCGSFFLPTGNIAVRIFVCFASEQRNDAELIAVSLRARGHAVFFSKDTLPVAESFDERIEKAVIAADLLIFLVSPQSIARGNYTLTELAYARAKWPNPSGRVLPVMVAPTEMDKVPAYLRTVGILDPEGNIAAETAAHVDKLNRKMRPGQVLLFAVGGIISGILCYLWVRYAAGFDRFSFVTAHKEGAPIMCGIIFGTLLATCNFKFGLRDRAALVAIVVFTSVSWVAAYDSAQIVYKFLDRFERTVRTEPQYDANESTTDNAPVASDQPESSLTKTEKVPYGFALAGFGGGFVGGLGTVLGIALLNRRFRQPEDLLLVTVVAMILGGLLELMNADKEGHVMFLSLFVCWQSAVTALIARTLSSAQPDTENLDFRSVWQH